MDMISTDPFLNKKHIISKWKHRTPAGFLAKTVLSASRQLLH